MQKPGINQIRGRKSSLPTHSNRATNENGGTLEFSEPRKARTNRNEKISGAQVMPLKLS